MCAFVFFNDPATTEIYTRSLPDALPDMSISATDDAKADLSKAQAEEKKLKKEERDWEKKVEEYRQEEKKMPWNVDTLSKPGFSKARLDSDS